MKTYRALHEKALKKSNSKNQKAAKNSNMQTSKEGSHRGKIKNHKEATVFDQEKLLEER